MNLSSNLKSWFSPAVAQARISRLDGRLDRLADQREEQRKALDRREAELSALAERIGRDLENARRTDLRYEVALEEVREQNRVLEMTVQTLVASHKLLQERYDAETAIQVRNRVAVSNAMRE